MPIPNASAALGGYALVSGRLLPSKD